MKIALSISKDGRINYACVVLPKGNYDSMPIVDTLPDGDVTDYLYIDNEYVYDPLPEPEQPEEDNTPSQLDIIEAQVTYTAMMTDTLLEVL